MARRKFCLILMALFFSVLSCNQATTASVKKNKKPTSSLEKLKTAEIAFGKVHLTIWIAKTMDEQRKGLMFKKSLDENKGMLFVYDHLGFRSFWMKNTLVPLSIGFFDDSQTLFQIEKMRPVKSFFDQDIDKTSSHQPAQYALEVNQGWFKTNKILKGQKFKWIKKPN